MKRPTTDLETPSRRGFLQNSIAGIAAAGIAAGSAGCIINNGVVAMIGAPRRHFDYVLPTEQEVRDTNLALLCMDLEHRFAANGAIGPARERQDLDAAQGIFEGLCDMVNAPQPLSVGKKDQAKTNPPYRTGTMLPHRGEYGSSQNARQDVMCFAGIVWTAMHNLNVLEGNDSLLVEAMNERGCSQYLLSYLIKGMGERFNLPVDIFEVNGRRYNGLTVGSLVVTSGEIFRTSTSAADEQGPALVLRGYDSLQGSWRVLRKREAVAEYLGLIAHHLLNNQEFRAGMEVTDLAVDWAPTNPLVNYISSLAHFANRDIDGAREFYERTLELDREYQFPAQFVRAIRGE